ncbi:hypothetical protein H5185_06825 [Shewanella sp. SG44-6]|nr:hypothetical protein [Shewanella sp. SG44-6]MBB1389141.1 hypothetical protein [Shewanella sp. SG44-6]
MSEYAIHVLLDMGLSMGIFGCKDERYRLDKTSYFYFMMIWHSRTYTSSMMFAIKACLIRNEALKYTYIDDIKKANAV